jgi:hypothetical protein
MRCLLLVVTSVSILAGYAALQTLQPFAPEPSLKTAKITLSLKEIRIPNVRQGQMVHADFPVHNVGGQRLVIIAEDRNCCQEEMNRVVVAPGHSEMLHLSVNTGNLETNRSNRYRFSTNDPELPVFDLTLIVEFGDQPAFTGIEPVPVDDLPRP